MTESSARTILTVSGTTATIAYILAIYFGLRGDQLLSIALFIVAIADSIIAYVFYRQYTRLRDNRWNDEIQELNKKMSDLLTGDNPSNEAKTGETQATSDE